MGKLKTLWHDFVQFHQSRLLPSLTNLTVEEYHHNVQVHFDAAKRLSDFVGIIIRWSFAQFASLYFFSKAFDGTGSLIRGYVYGLCAFMSVALAGYLGASVGIIIVLYYARDFTHREGPVARRITIIIVVITTLALWLGTYDLTRDIAKASKLLGGA